MSSTNKRIDLFTAKASDVLDLIYSENDPTIIHVLMDLHEAKCEGDIDGEIDAIDALTDRLVLERGMGWMES